MSSLAEDIPVEVTQVLSPEMDRLHSLAGIWSWILDGEGKITWCGEGCKTIVGCETSELVGKSWRKLFDPEDQYREWPRQLANLLMEAGAGKPSYTRLAFSTVAKDGRPVYVESSLFATTHGGNSAIFGLSIDISARKEAEFLHRNLIEHLPGIIYTATVNPTRPTLYVSPQIANLLGEEPQVFEDDLNAWYHHLHPEDSARVVSYLEACMKEVRGGTMEYRLVAKDGHEVWFRDDFVVVPFPGTKTPIYYQGIMADITHERMLRQRVHMQTSALQATANGVMITDGDGKIQWVNEAFCVLSGYTEQEVIGTDAAILSDGSGNLPFQEIRTEAVKNHSWRGELSVRRKNSGLYVEDMTLTPIMGENSKITHFVAIKQDVTSRKELERFLQHIRAAVDGTSDALLLTDSAAVPIYMNEAFNRISGYSLSEVAPLEPAQWLEGNLDNVACCNASAESSPLLLELNLKTKQGKLIPILLRQEPVVYFDGTFGGLSIGITDLTEKKNRERQAAMMELQLRHSQKMESIGQLAAGVAHEINTPAQFVGDNIHFFKDHLPFLLSVCSEAIRMGSDQPGDAKEKILEIVKAQDLSFIIEELPTAIDETLDGMNRITNIVKALKEFSHPGKEEKSMVDLNHAVRNTSIVARNEWKYVAELVLDLDPKLPNVFCIPGLINQVVLNILVNASHAVGDVCKTKPGWKGKITMSTKYLGDRVEISIQDTGAGIPEAIKQKVFDPFFTTKEVGKGTGQGLALAYDVIVVKHGGTLTFDSEVGQGTTFHIQLPLEMKDENKQTTQQQPTT